MAQGEGGGGHFADSGGYGGNFGGAGGAARNAGGSNAEHGLLGYGGMSPGGYNSTVYNANKMGWGGVPGFGARVQANRANYAQRQKLQALMEKYPNNIALKQRYKALTQKTILTNPKTQPVEERVIPESVVATETLPEDTPEGLPSGLNPGMRGLRTVEGPYGNWNQENVNPGMGGPQNSFDTGGPYGGGRVYGGKTIGDRLGGWQGNPNRQFGGPVAGGRSYTVGENGPETLRMGPGGGGQVIPHNPMDRAAGGFNGGLNDAGPNPAHQAFMQQQQGGGFPGGPTPLNNQPLGGMDPAAMQQMFRMWQQQHQNPQTQPPQPSQGGGFPGRPTPQTQPPGGAGPAAMAQRLQDWFQQQHGGQQQQPHIGVGGLQPPGGGGFPGGPPQAPPGAHSPSLPPAPPHVGVGGLQPPDGGGFQGRDQGYGAGGIGWHGGNNWGSGAPGGRPGYGSSGNGQHFNNFGSGAPGGRPSYQGMGFGGNGLGISGILNQLQGRGFGANGGGFRLS